MLAAWTVRKRVSLAAAAVPGTTGVPAVSLAFVSRDREGLPLGSSDEESQGCMVNDNSDCSVAWICERCSCCVFLWGKPRLSAVTIWSPETRSSYVPPRVM